MFFGIGLPELMVIAFVGLLVFGPEQLPTLAKQAGQVVRKLRVLADNARDELRTELGPEYSDLQLRDLDPRQVVRRHITDAIAELDAADEAALEAATALPHGSVPPFDHDAT